MGFVAAGAACVGVGLLGASVGWDGACRVETLEVLAGKLEVFVDVQFVVALALILASSVGAAGVHSPVESGSLGVSEAAADSHFVDVAAADLGMAAGTEVECQAEGPYSRVGMLVGSGEEGEGQLLVQVGIPEAAVGGTAAAASAAVVAVQDFGIGHERALLVGA